MDMQLVEKIKEELEQEMDSLDGFGSYNSTSKYEFDTDGNIISNETEIGVSNIESGVGFKEENKYFLDEKSYAILELIEKYSRSEEEVHNMGVNKYTIGFTVIEKDIAYRLLKGQKANLKSELIVESGFIGKGMYFYESSYKYAKEHANNSKIVIGAVINKGNILDFTTGKGQSIVTEYCKRFKERFKREPINDTEFIEELIKESKIKYDTIKSLVIKGNKLYEKSTIHQCMSNIICVRKDTCIVEWFNPSKESVKEIVEKYNIQI